VSGRPAAPEYRSCGGRADARRITDAMSLTKEESHMKWETPVAIDLRFGMEITMYVANR
jgi:coenzyme PQQ precursor peptide PqqA